MNKFLALVIVGSGAMLTACGGDSLGDRVDLQIDPNTGQAYIEIEMSDGLEVNLDGEFEIGGNGYGTLEFRQATRSENASVRVNLDVLAVIEDQVDIDDLGAGLVTALPNGAPFPVAMSAPLARIPVVKSGSVRADALVGLVPELQLGTFIYIDQFRSQYFPAGVSICQNFRNQDNLAFAAVCLFGPSADSSGGIFVGGNFGQVLDFELPILTPEEDDTEFVAMSMMSMRALSLESSAQQPAAEARLKLVDSAQESSYLWTESRYDPRRKLNGREGQKALRNAKRILRAR